MTYTTSSALALCRSRNWLPLPTFQFVNTRTRIPGTCSLCKNFNAKGLTLKQLKQRPDSSGGCGICRNLGLSARVVAKRVPLDQVRREVTEAGWTITDDDFDYQNVHTPISGFCTKCGDSGSVTLKSVRSGGGICFGSCRSTNCSNGQRTPLADLEAEVRSLKWVLDDGVVPETVTTKLYGKCQLCKRKGSPKLSNIRHSERTLACRYCSRSGRSFRSTNYYTDNKIRYFYVVSFSLEGETVYKYGMGGKSRLKSHRKEGVDFAYLGEYDAYIALCLEKMFEQQTDLTENLNEHPEFPLHRGGTECYRRTPGNVFLGLDLSGNLVSVPM